MAKHSSSSPPQHRGRIQAQGAGTEKSEAWAQDDPPTKSQMLLMLEDVWNSLSDAEQNDREECYVAMRTYIEQAPASGIDAPLSKTFRNRKKRGGVRMDLEIRTGTACVDD